jgi:DNA-binding response OmpR family regulator
MAEPTPVILVVDDNEDLLGTIAAALEMRGYRVVTADNGKSALAELERGMPALILLDMNMPVLDGAGFVREFRNRFGRRVPIAVMTAAEDSKVRAEEVGADAYLGKPFDVSDLITMVEDALTP